MSIKDVRAGVAQSKQNENAFALVMFEVLMIAIGVGVFNDSWVWGTLTFFGMLILMSTEHASKAVPPLAAIAWGYIGYSIGGYFGETNTAVMVGLVFAAMSYGLHLQALVHFVDLDRRDTKQSVPDHSQTHGVAIKQPEGAAEENNLRGIFRSADTPIRGSDSPEYGRYTSIAVFVIGLFAMLFWWMYEPDPTRDFDARSLQTWSELNEADRKIYQMLPDKLRSHVDRLDDGDQTWYVKEWDKRRKMSCPFGTSQTERFDEYYGLRECLSKDERDLIDFAIDHVLSR